MNGGMEWELNRSALGNGTAKCWSVVELGHDVDDDDDGGREEEVNFSNFSLA